MTRCFCWECDCDVPGNVDGTPKRHLRRVPGTGLRIGGGRLSGLVPCPGGRYDLHGILMSDPMVCAILEGRKSVTRRVSLSWLKRRVGDVLWVREAYTAATAIEESGETHMARPYHYRATESAGGPWRSSLLMPYTASRIRLVITEEPRMEYVRDITEEEVLREGCIVRPMSRYWMDFGEVYSASAVDAYREAWEYLHPGTWDTARVVRIAFERERTA